MYGVNTNLESKSLDIKQYCLYYETLVYLSQNETGTVKEIKKSLITPELLEKLICEGKCEVSYDDGFYFVKKADEE